MEAARAEFAERGLAGARVDSIAKRAGLSKQLLYHYFPSKEALFEETLESKYQHYRATTDETEGPGALFRQRFDLAGKDPVWMRFLTWEAAEHEATGRITAEAARRASIERQAAAIRSGQARGDLPADLPPELLQLAINALAVYPHAFAHVAEMITGRSPQDPKFRAEWSDFLDELARRLANK